MDQVKDKNGKTEQQFLRDYDVTKYFRPSVTVDVVLYAKIGGKLRVLLVKRGGHPFLGKYAFPGGFVDKDESCEAAAARELMEETNVADIHIRQLLTASTPGRDPRWRNITVVFCGEISGDVKAVAGDDAADAVWFDIECFADGRIEFESEKTSFTVKLDVARDVFGNVDINDTQTVERGESAFDHAKIVYYLYDKVYGGMRGENK